MQLPHRRERLLLLLHGRGHDRRAVVGARPLGERHVVVVTSDALRAGMFLGGRWPRMPRRAIQTRAGQHRLPRPLRPLLHRSDTAKRGRRLPPLFYGRGRMVRSLASRMAHVRA